MAIGFGPCFYCGVFGRTTKDHKNPRRVRLRLHALGWLSGHHPWVPACDSCQKRKADRDFKEFQGWLMSEAGYHYLKARNAPFRRSTVRGPCQVPASPGLIIQVTSQDGVERHYCAAHKACGVLRRRLFVIGDGASVWKPLGLIA